MASREIQLRFDGLGPHLTFIEAEDAETGEPIDVGEWEEDGEYRLLKLEVDDGE